MSGQEIRQKIDENNKKIRLKLDTFVLTDEIKKCLAENAELQKICEHEFDEDNICIYCDICKEDIR